MRKATKIRILVCLLAASALWAALVEERSVPALPSAGADPAAHKNAATQPSARFGAELAARRPLPAIDVDPFAAQSTLPRAPKAAAAAATAPRSAPPMPYRVAGRLRTHSGVQIFLARGDEVFPIRENDMLDGQYRVESLASTQVVLVHVPTSTRETLAWSPDESRQAASPADADSGTAASAPKAPARGVAFTLQGPPQATEGREFDLVMRMSSSERVFNVPMQLLFDAAVLQPVSVRPGAYFAADEERFRYRITPQGTIYVAASRSAPAATSDAEIAVFTFRPLKASAAAEVRVATLRAEGPDRRTLAHQDVVPFRTAIAP